MFEFAFKDSEYEALDSVIAMCGENCDGQLPIWIYLGCDVRTMDLDNYRPSERDGQPNDSDELAK